MHDTKRTAGIGEVLTDRLEDNLFIGSIFREDLLVGRAGISRIDKKNHHERTLETRFGIVPVKSIAI